MNNVQDRLKELVNTLSGGKYTVFAKRCGIPHSTLQNYMNGRAPHLDHLLRIHDFYGVDLNWLLTGKGKPYLNDARPEPSLEGNETQAPYRDRELRSGSSNSVEFDHGNIIKQFTDKSFARDIYAELVKIEHLSPSQYRELGAYIKGISKGLENSPQSYSGPDRREGERRILEQSEENPIAQDRRNGLDRRKAAVGK